MATWEAVWGHPPIHQPAHEYAQLGSRFGSLWWRPITAESSPAATRAELKFYYKLQYSCATDRKNFLKGAPRHALRASH